MIAVHVFSQPEVLVTSWIEWLTVIGIFGLLGGLITAYRKINCHRSGCWRIGRFPHGHFHLCHVHHPKVPDDGKITAEHISKIK